MLLANRMKKLKISYAIFCAAIFVLLFVCALVFSLLTKSSMIALYQNCTISLISSFIIIFSYSYSNTLKKFIEFNQNQYWRFYLGILFFVVIFILSSVFPFITVPFGVAAIMLLLFSGVECSLFTYFSLVLEYCVLYKPSSFEVLILISTGLFAIVLFSTLDTKFNYFAITISYLIFDFLIYFVLLLDNETYKSIDKLLIENTIRVVIELFILLVLLRLISVYLVHRNDNYFSVISDPEFELLERLKEIDESAYYHAIHTAHLADLAAKSINADSSLAMAGGYYHKIGLLQGKDNIQNTINVANSYLFPQELIDLLLQYGTKNTSVLSKEAAIVQLSDAMVSSVTYMFQKDSNADLNYEKIIDVIIKKKTEGGDFIHCELSIHDLSIIKKIFAEETSYYDFLR